MKPYEDFEGSFTAAGIDAMPRAASEHVALERVPEPRPSRWQRFLAWFGLSDA